MYGTLVILKQKGELQKFNKWRDELRELITLTKMPLIVVDYTLLNLSIDMLMEIETIMDTFVKEAIALIDTRYTQRSTKVHTLLDVKWPIEEYTT